jgi:hypothetical protein
MDMTKRVPTNPASESTAVPMPALPEHGAAEEAATTLHGSWRRRGLLGAVGAALFGVLAKGTEQTSSALNGGNGPRPSQPSAVTGAPLAANGDPVNVAALETGTLSTEITNTSASAGVDGAAFNAWRPASLAGPGGTTHRAAIVAGATDDPGLIARSTNHHGFLGISSGESALAPGRAGAAATSTTGTGMWGTSTSNHGVVGQTTGVNRYGILGNNLNAAAGNGGVGLGGYSFNIGIYGAGKANGVGVQGDSGVADPNSSALGAGIGIWGNAAGAGYAIYGNNADPAGYAGRFNGNVGVQGSIRYTGALTQVVGLSPASTGAGARRTAEDTRTLYAVHSPENWLEDFGEGTIQGGQATITLDSGFAALIEGPTYHVFLTSHDDMQLHVKNRTPRGFEVRVSSSAGARAADQAAGRGTGTFSYRVVGKRAGQATPRLGPVTLPAAPEPREAPPLVPHEPAPPAPVTVPAPPRR